MSSLSDQLLKAGLVTKEQVEKATEKPKKYHKQTKTEAKKNYSRVKEAHPKKQQQKKNSQI